MKKLTGPCKWHGGKCDLATWIISLMPERCKTPNKPDPEDDGWLHYVEPYLGGGAVLLAMDPEEVSEVVNDLNGGLTNFWQTLQGQTSFNQFKRLIEAVPFSKIEFDNASKNSILEADGYGHSVHKAATFFIHCRQSLAGRMKGFTGITKTRVRRKMNNEVSAWLTAVEGLPAVHARLKRVLILNDDALTVIRKQDGPRTLYYLDPPYLHETRATTGEYQYEMTEDQHGLLLELLGSSDLKGRFMLSGYHSDLYDDWASACKWTCHEKKINNHAASGKTKRIMTECLWCNF